MIPAPKHLKNYVFPIDSIKDDNVFLGAVHCSCGNETFELLYPGQTKDVNGLTIPCTAEFEGHYFFLVKAFCTRCEKEHLLFDKDLHGWDGFICHDEEQASLPRPPLIKWKCLSCNGLEHRCFIRIYNQTKQEFVIEVGNEINENSWPNAFEWFSMSITCCKCKLETEAWIDYETA